MKPYWVGLIGIIVIGFYGATKISSAYYDTVTDILVYSEPARVEFPEYIILTNQKVYGYSSTVGQTDSNPFRTASGTRTRKGIIANNCYDFGQRLRIHRRSGLEDFPKEFVVEDRMNSRYGCDSWDIWFESKQEALNWGIKTLTIRIRK